MGTSPRTIASTEAKWSKQTWHRKATKPVTLWLLALVIAGLIHPLLPEFRWVLIHLFTLGAITNSVVVWSQYFTEKLLELHIPDSQRGPQLLKIRILNAGIIVTLAGQLLSQAFAQHWIITSLGALLISGALLWHALSLAQQLLKAPRGQRYRSAIVAYVASASCLPFGALAGGFLAKELSNTWQERVVLAHVIINILGFVGFAALGSLSFLFGRVWHTAPSKDYTRFSVALMVPSLPIMVAGALFNEGYVAAAGLILYTLAWLLGIFSWARIVLEACQAPGDRINFAAASVATAPLWLLGSLIYLIIQTFSHPDTLFHLSPPTLALLIGFGAQLLFGVMSYLLPATMGGGEAAIRTGTYRVNVAGLFRWTLLNGGLLIWLSTENSWLRVCASLLSIGALVAFIPLLATAVKAQRGVITKKRTAAPLQERSHFNQITAGISLLALLIACFGGLNPDSSNSSTTITTPAPGELNGDTYAITISAGNLIFTPKIIEVPAGAILEVTLVNEDTMVHDMKFANGVRTGRVAPGKKATVTVGQITTDMEGWCTIAGHRAQGMVLNVRVQDPNTGAESAP